MFLINFYYFGENKFLNSMKIKPMRKLMFYFISAVILIGWNIQSNLSADKQILKPNYKMNKEESKKGKVTGIGGIFFKSKDAEKTRDWYSKNLGMVTDEYGTMFKFRLENDPEKAGYLQWSPFAENTKYFDPSDKDFMINYRVENIEDLVEQLKSEGVTIVDTLQTYSYGKFIHIMDAENNKLKLWEPVDEAFDK